MTTTTPVDGGRLRRVQLGARATLTLGIGASLAANVLAAEPTFIGRVIAAWSPIALLLTVELLSRVPASGGWLSRLRIAAAATIAAIAAWVSYWHIADVAETFGEASVAAHLLPLSIDGLVVVASVCLVELNQRAPGADITERADDAAAGPVERTSRPAATHRPRTKPSAAAPVTKRGSRRNGSARVSLGDEVRRLAVEHPDWTQAELAEVAGCSVRTVRRHLTVDQASTAAESTEHPMAADTAGEDEEVAA